MTVYAFGEYTPEIAETAYIHPQASVIGDVKIGERVFVAPMASIRGDRGRIEIGDESNIQDGAVIHSESGIVTWIGRRVNIGHNASIHSERIEDFGAVGMGAVLMVGSVVAEGALIANSALLHPKTRTEPYSIYAGVPAKLMRKYGKDDSARAVIDEYLDHYVEFALSYAKKLRRISD
ncbi:MAG: gamma carbonic anhydrase family protein [Candidatus Thorarchaeota archaeon]|nr:MAG: gamma carbonic anhydrase family protein [Candidatus Thorarchaeota archaeon]